MSSFLAVSLAMASASPVTILILTPIVSAVAMVALASSRGGSNRGNTPTNCHGPSPSARATPSDAKAARREVVHGFLDGALHLRRHWPTAAGSPAARPSPP